jgi:hypothetical protein
MFKKLSTTTRYAALFYAKKSCRYNRMSFDGVSWQSEETGQLETLTWKEADTTSLTSPPHSQ